MSICNIRDIDASVPGKGLGAARNRTRLDATTEPALFAVTLRCSGDRKGGAYTEMCISGLMTFELQNHDIKITECVVCSVDRMSAQKNV